MFVFYPLNIVFYPLITLLCFTTSRHYLTFTPLFLQFISALLESERERNCTDDHAWRDVDGQRQLVRHFEDVAFVIHCKFRWYCIRWCLRKPQPIAHKAASTKHVLAYALHKLLPRTSVSILRSVTLSSTCRFAFMHNIILMSNVFNPNTQVETVGAYTLTTLSLSL